jgi:triacylglycerol lipase
MLQQMSSNGRASMGGAIYANELVKEEGIWKFSKVHAYNTFTADYEGGWARASSSSMPGPSPDFPPDAPPSTQIAMLPVVYEIPYHYANPVSGRTQTPALPSIAAQLAGLARGAPAAALPIAAAAAQVPVPEPLMRSPGTVGGQALIANTPREGYVAPPGMPPEVASGLREIGARIEAPRTTALYAPLHARLVHDAVDVRRELAYGPHERHRADVFLPKARGTGRPLLVFVHGGGFARGAKSTAGQFYYDNIGYWAAEHGLVGVTVNYRLAPEFQFPAGAADVERMVAWLRAQARGWGADPERIFLFGHSAGGAHVADYLARTPQPPVAGAILMSGIYSLGNTVSTWSAYYGEDVSKYPERTSLPRLIQHRLPLLVAWAELDPENFVPDSEQLVAGRESAGRPTVALRLPNHSHLSEAYAIGTADESLTVPLLRFIEAPPK